MTRTDYMVEKTTTSTFKGAAYFRPSKTVNLRARYEQSMTTDAFANLNAAKPAILQTVPTPSGLPFGPQSLQYFEMYNSRSVNLSGVPDRHEAGRPRRHVGAVAEVHGLGPLPVPRHEERRTERLHLEPRHAHAGRRGLRGPDGPVHAGGGLGVPEGHARYGVQHPQLRWLSGRSHRDPVGVRA